MAPPRTDHRITIQKNPRRVRAFVAGHVIADTADALTLSEEGHEPVQYFPRKDVETGFMSQTSKVTECPYKGLATHYSMMIDGELLENAVWSYENPKPGMEQIAGRMAFYPDKVEVYEPETERPHNAHLHP